MGLVYSKRCVSCGASTSDISATACICGREFPRNDPESLRAEVASLKEELHAAKSVIFRYAREKDDLAYQLAEKSDELVITFDKISGIREWKQDNQWQPDICPITRRPFFMWIEHPEKGWVPTYGGPYDSYTIAEPDADGTFFCERYDHDLGGWLVDETVGIGLRLIDDQREDHEYGTVEPSPNNSPLPMGGWGGCGQDW